MGIFDGDKSITVTEYKNGWLLEWRDDGPRKVARELRSRDPWDSDYEAPTSGKEIYTNQRELSKRIAEFLCISFPPRKIAEKERA